MQFYMRALSSAPYTMSSACCHHSALMDSNPMKAQINPFFKVALVTAFYHNKRKLIKATICQQDIIIVKRHMQNMNNMWSVRLSFPAISVGSQTASLIFKTIHKWYFLACCLHRALDFAFISIKFTHKYETQNHTFLLWNEITFWSPHLREDREII